MREIIAYGIPPWAIYILIGVLPAIFVGYLFRKTRLRKSSILAPIIVLIVFVLGTEFVVRKVVEPWLLPDRIVLKLNERVPRKVDDATTWVWTQFRDDTFIFYYEVTDPEIKPEDLDSSQTQAEIKKTMCETLQVISEYGDFQKLERRYVFGKTVKSIAASKADCP